MNDIPTSTKRMERVKIECCPECNGYGFVRVAEDENSISAKTCSDCRCSGLVAKLATNADRIRAMSDDLLATQLVQVVKETIKALTELDLPDEISSEIRSNFLDKLKQPAEE